jgi:hypothetical protein
VILVCIKETLGNFIPSFQPPHSKGNKDYPTKDTQVFILLQIIRINRSIMPNRTGAEKLRDRVNTEYKTPNFQTKYEHVRGKPNWFFKVENGSYKFECTGFVKYMLMKEFSGIKNHDNFQNADGINWMDGHLSFLLYTNPETLNQTYKSAGSPDQWVQHAQELKPGEKKAGSMMRRLVNLSDIKAGCILITKNHVMISMGTVQHNGALRVADSTSTPHGSHDDRQKTTSKSGFGKGYISVGQDSNGLVMKWSMEFNGPLIKMYVLKPVA